MCFKPMMCTVLLTICVWSTPQCFAQRKFQPTAEQKATLKSFLMDHVNDKKITYEAAFVDLKNNGAQEVITYFTDTGSCGTGGCLTLILEPQGSSSYKVISSITITNPPIRILSSKSNGWYDISVVVTGGGIHPGYEAKLSFDGTTYPSNPSVPPAQRLSEKTDGIVVIAGTQLRRVAPTNAAVSEVETIVPGHSVGRLRLGMKEKDLRAPIFPWKTTPSVVQPKAACDQVTVRWWGGRIGVTAYLLDDNVYQIDASADDLFRINNTRLANNIKASDLKTIMPEGTLVRWASSSSQSPSGKDIMFWVNEEKGIAFSLDYDPYDVKVNKLGSRVVQSVSVFKAGTKFQPNGCFRPPQALVPAENVDDESRTGGPTSPR